MNIKYIATFLISSILFLMHSATQAQDSPVEVHEHYSNLYPDESGIISEYKRIIRIKRAGDSLNIVTEHYKEILVLNKPSRWVKDKIFSNSFSAVEDIEAYTLLPGKRRYKQIDVEDFKRTYDKDTYVFYDDTEVINYNFPAIEEGAKIVTSYRSKSRDPHILGNFYFSAFIPSLHSSLQIIVDKGIEINHGILNDSLATISYAEETLKDGSKVYTYEAFDMPKIDFEDDNPGFGYLSPSAYVLIANYENTKNETIPVLSSLDNLYEWYTTFLKHTNNDSSVKQFTQSIVKAEDDSVEKVKKIFYWVQRNVKYIAFEDGMRGFVPHSPDYVLEKRYGDCKDMTSLLVGMLRSQGFDANYTWIGTREIPYKYSELPSPLVDNHMIAAVTINDKIFYLDATGGYSPLGYPTAMIQGKECLISRGDNYKLATVPIIEKEQNQMNDSSVIRLKDGGISGEGQLTLSGLVKVANTYNLIQRTANKEENYIRRVLSRGNNTFLVDNYDVKNVKDFDEPIKIAYQFDINDYYSQIEDEIYINLCLDRSLMDRVIKDRRTPIENDFKYITSSYTTLEIPEGYKVEFVPKAKNFSTPFLGFDISYELNSDSIVLKSQIYVDFLMLYPSNFDAWNEAINSYAQATRKTIILKRLY